MQIYAIVAAPRDKVRKLQTTWPRIVLVKRKCNMETSILLLALVALRDAVGPHDPS